MIKRTCVALLAGALAATPAAARDKSLYIGIEAGPMWASDIDFDGETSTASIDDILTIDHRLGYDVGAIFGYDGGLVRAELDLSYKRAGHDEYEVRGLTGGSTTFDADGRTRYIAVLTNLLLDVGNENGFSFYAGPGLGFAWGKFRIEDSTGGANFRDGGVAWQLIAGARYAINPKVDVGLKYRYFHPSRIRESDSGIDYTGRFRSHSLLATLTYNFYEPPAPPPPPLPPPPPAPPPATQTCPDGSVILATDACPPPPPPPAPPPPMPEPERG